MSTVVINGEANSDNIDNIDNSKRQSLGSLLMELAIIALLIFASLTLMMGTVKRIEKDKKAVNTHFENVSDYGKRAGFMDAHYSFMSNGTRYYMESTNDINGNSVLNILASDDAKDAIMTIDTNTNKIIWEKDKDK